MHCVKSIRIWSYRGSHFQVFGLNTERYGVIFLSGNFEITMNEIKNLKQEISELKSSLDFTEKVLRKKVEKLEENMKDVDTRMQDIYEYQVDPNYVLDKLA